MAATATERPTAVNMDTLWAAKPAHPGMQHSVWVDASHEWMKWALDKVGRGRWTGGVERP